MDSMKILFDIKDRMLYNIEILEQHINLKEVIVFWNAEDIDKLRLEIEWVKDKEKDFLYLNQSPICSILCNGILMHLYDRNYTYPIEKYLTQE